LNELRNRSHFGEREVESAKKKEEYVVGDRPKDHLGRVEREEDLEQAVDGCCEVKEFDREE